MKRFYRKYLTIKPWLLYTGDVDEEPEGGGGKEPEPEPKNSPSENEVKLADALKEAQQKLADMEKKFEDEEQKRIDADSKDELDRLTKTVARLENEKKKNEEETAKLKKRVALSDRDKLLSKFFKEKASGENPKRYDSELIMELLGDKIPDNIEVAISELETRFPRIVITEKDNHPSKLPDKKGEKELGGFQLADDILKKHGNKSVSFREKFTKDNEKLLGR